MDGAFVDLTYRPCDAGSPMANVVLRSAVWIGVIVVWLALRRPEGMGWTEVAWGPTAVAAAVVAIAGIAGYVWTAIALAGEVPNAIDAPAHLLTRGPFAFVRNPLYLSVGAVLAGLTTMYGLWERRDGIVVPIVGVLVHLFVVYREEPRTRDRVGPAYDTYRATVPRWIPRL
jgi:protein-S-isoprenylcysteine O-methyltransferase Ste14